MKYIYLLLFFPVLACSSPAELQKDGSNMGLDSKKWTVNRKFTGSYTTGFETSSFQPDGSSERWWLKGMTSCNIPDDNRRTQSHSYYVEFLGKVSPPGRYGHLGMYTREVIATKVMECR